MTAVLRDALTLPNAVSALRLVAIPYFWWVLVGERRIVLAATLIFLIGSTDWVDGYLARRLGQVSELGKLLDPLADRLMIASALLAGLLVRVLPTVVGALLLLRELLVGLGAVYLGIRSGRKLDVRPLGKLATFLVYGAVPSFYLVSAGVAPWLFGPPAWLGGVVGLVLYYWVGAAYFTDIRRTSGGIVPGDR